MIVKFGVVNLLINNKSFCGLKTVELSQRQKCWTKQWVYVRGLCKAKSLVCPKPTAKNQKQPPWPGDLTPTPSQPTPCSSTREIQMPIAFDQTPIAYMQSS